ncbi:unnamed protein product [Tenebrio molitor]|nr:unnamed protein product [Tenebrio molitor]
MKLVLILAVICLAISQTLADDQLDCYTCKTVTTECEVDDATLIKCGNPTTSRCSRQIKKGASDATKAIRKCVIPDKNGQVPCPTDYDCQICDSDGCNAGTSVKFTWFSLVGVFVAVLLMK